MSKITALIKRDKQYQEWILSIYQRFRQSQIQAVIKVNSEMLRLYWSIGRDISQMSFSAQYGSAFYQTISQDLKKHLPEVRSFSVTNLKYMRYFYEMYPNVANRQQVADDFDWEMIFQIPWGHHIVLINAYKNDIEQAKFYIQQILENNWSRAVLLNFIDTNLYERQGKAISNFQKTLPNMQGDLAQSITKDPYHFDFLSIREKYDEKELKIALMSNINKFLLELGNGFAFVGQEYRIQVGNTEKFIDMLFYHIPLNCYVVLEVKVCEFDSAFMGQLGTYVVAVNHQLKTEQMNPTIGLLVCKSMDKIEAQYAIESSTQPIGISAYELSKLIPERFKGSLPTIEEIETELSHLKISVEN